MWVLLLRAVNVGGRNTLAMADLRALLTALGHRDVTTILNSGNATFTSARRSRSGLANEIEAGLLDRLGLTVRATLRTEAELRAALAALPAEVEQASYAVISFLFDRPLVSDLSDWDVAPDRLVMGDGVAYIGYAGPAHASKLTNAALEKRLGVGATARTPATIRKLLAS